MAPPNVLSFNPIWYIADLTGKPLGGGFLSTQRSLNPEQLKLVYKDASNNAPWPYVQITNVNRLGILFDENGQQGPFYFAFDPSVPKETYLLQVYDSSGVLVWTVDHYFPPSGSGGGDITTVVDLENIIINNVMYRNLGVTPVTTTQVMKLAPGAHSAIPATTTASNVALGSLPDVYLLKNNLAASDMISFPRFTVDQSTSFAPDTTPIDFLEYACSNSPAGETQKCVQFPITKGVQNLSGQPCTVTIWARATAGSSPTLQLVFRQFFGDGAPASPDVFTAIGAPLPLTNAWQQFSFTSIIPDVFGTTLGQCGNDTLFLQVQFPLGVICTIDFTKPAIYLNDVAPSIDYHTYDMIDGIINAPRTGYVFGSYDLVAPPGYLMLDDTNIGSSASTATHKGTDYFPLYNWLWLNVSSPSANANCPVTGGLGANAVADFTANKNLALPKALGRVLGGAGSGAGLTPRVLGSFLGTETISIADMPSHTHTADVFSPNPNSPPLTTFSSFNAAGTMGTATTNARGGSGADGKMQPTSFLNYFIKL